MNPGGFAAEGQGWRLAWEADRQPFAVLIGGEGWAAELTAAEALSLRDALLCLREQHRAFHDRLMAEEEISLELERGAWWVALDGDRNAWSLRVVLTPGPMHRAIEGSWAVPAAAALVQALEGLPL